MEIRNQLGMFPDINRVTMTTQAEALEAVEKFFGRVQRATNEMSRQVLNSVVGSLTFTKRGKKPMNKDCTLWQHEKVSKELHNEIVEVLDVLHSAPPCDYFGQIATEHGALDKHKSQFLHPLKLAK